MDTRKLFLGKAGEYRVVSELLLRGFEPCVTSIDIGTDIVLIDGTKIQVKTCSSVFNAMGSGQRNPTKYFMFSMQRGLSKNIKNLKIYCDFIICWVTPTNDFYIIPMENIVKNNMCIPVNKENQWDIYKNNWELLRKGKIING